MAPRVQQVCKLGLCFYLVMYSQTFGLKLFCIIEFDRLKAWTNPSRRWWSVTACSRSQPVTSTAAFCCSPLTPGPESSAPVRTVSYLSVRDTVCKLSSRYSFIFANKCPWLRFALQQLHIYSSVVEFSIENTQKITLSKWIIKCWNHQFLRIY